MRIIQTQGSDLGGVFFLLFADETLFYIPFFKNVGGVLQGEL